ncbi:MAG: hypothetical protein GY765_07130 [bacterium]|nr:hypothetical protein [bacterium]
MNSIIVDLVRVGLHGFALALAYLGYSLLKKITNQELPADNPTELKKFEMSLKSVRFFLVISLIFFFGGAALHIVDKYYDVEKEYKIQLSIYPEKLPEELMPSIRNAGTPITLTSGTALLKINGKSSLVINAEKLQEELKVKDKKIMATTENEEEGGI